MKKHDFVKTLQLVIFLALTAFCAFVIFTRPALYHAIATDSRIRVLFVLLWIILGLSFLFIFVDFCFLSSYKKDFRELDYAVHSDPVSGIANRYSCDALIEKYLDKPVPAHFGCMMFELSNIREINERYGHRQGNLAIRDFSNILKLASVNFCFVGHNSGNRFLALFEDTDPSLMNAFRNRVDKRVDAYNSMSEKFLLKYACGFAYQKDDAAVFVTELIALASRRISQDTEC